MPLRISSAEIEKLASEVADLAGESKTEAIRRALLERKDLLLRGRAARRRERLDAFLRDRVWPEIPDDVREHPLTKEERERLLGYGPEGF